MNSNVLEISLIFLNISFISIIVELYIQVFQYINFKLNEICFPITKEDRQMFCKIIADQKRITDIVINDY